jgi:hypothetical protein
MRSLSLFSVLALAAVACVPAGVPPTNPGGPELSALSVAVPAPPAAALERVKAAFVTEGLPIADASSGGTVTSAPVQLTHVAGIGTLTVLYRATVLSQGKDSARVVLSGETRSDVSGSTPNVRPLTSHQQSTTEGHGWAKLERIAADLKP